MHLNFQLRSARNRQNHVRGPEVPSSQATRQTIPPLCVSHTASWRVQQALQAVVGRGSGLVAGVYSTSLDGAFCVCCALFAPAEDRKKMGVMVNVPFTKWHHKSDVIGKHPMKPSHYAAVEKAEMFLQSINKPSAATHVMLDNAKAANIEKNWHILRAVAEAVVYCGRQCIALRGDHEQPDSAGNPGNFLALMKLFSNHDEVLQEHMKHPQMRNATYISPRTQNEMIDIVGKQMIQAGIVQEIKDAHVYAIMVNEVTSHNVELMPLCVRFVDRELNIREELLEICTLARITRLHIATTIKQELQNLGIPLEACRGQGYDDATNTGSEVLGLQALIRNDAPKAVYTHCSGHCLNLVIAHSCALPVVRNSLDKLKMKASVMFFTNSPKRERLLAEVVTKGGHPLGLRKPLTDVCRTRWAARHDAYSHFYGSFIFIVKALEVMALGLHHDEYRTDVTTGWVGKYRAEANGLLSGLVKFDFIVTFLTVYQVLSHLTGITIKLQSTSLDIVQAYRMVEDVKDVYKNLRESTEADFTTIYEQAVRMAAAVEVEPAKPRGAGQQKDRSNTPAQTVEQYYLRNMAIPLVDHIITELGTQFSKLSMVSATLIGLVLSVLVREDTDISDAVKTYRDDLPSPELIHQEVKRWKLMWCKKHQSAEEIPATCATAIKNCDVVLLPNVFMLLKIACSLPVTSCELRDLPVPSGGSTHSCAPAWGNSGCPPWL